MLRHCRWITACLMLAACSLNTDDPSYTPGPASGIPAGPEATSPFTTSALIQSDTGLFANYTELLNGVCFEYLADRVPVTWTWTSTAEMDAFFDDVDRSGVCPAPAAHATFDFSDHLLVGAVQAAHGCDAAYRVSVDPQVQPPNLVLNFGLIVKPGCDYELVEPLLIAVPHLAQDAVLEVHLSAAP